MQLILYKKQRLVVHFVLWLLVFMLPFILPSNSDRFFTAEFLVPWLVGFATSVILFYTFYFFVFPRYLKQGTLLKFLAVSFLVFVVYISIDILLDQIIDLALGKTVNPFKFSQVVGRIFVNGFIVAAALFVSLVENWFSTQRYMQEMENQRLESELRMLRFQVNPHFLFNTLNNIYTLVYKKSDKAPEAMLKLSSLMRYMLYDTNDAYVPLSRELEYLENFVELQKLRLANSQQVNFRVTGKADSLVIAPLLLVPFIENAFKHGARATQQTAVNVDIAIDNGRLSFFCQNSFVPNLASEVNSGIGLENVKRRLELLYTNRSELRIEKTEQVFTVYLTLTLN